ncbi:signal transduction histidine kinase [Ulvibacter sp. MAR_2010_11]|uniref:sensor histidine kinase n=1 Tax=Ulvibacter sp. MAR_2010_11 TaxID=1250229 RepID=UPI000C2BC371|nr:HAMP domain-containing sensor histidine kinase [Ulvibacter sp. MAR_2010_11]PKA82086.1 signal transduction histidine kinase [Ulvibacter sp. MAR_2010_11]
MRIIKQNLWTLIILIIGCIAIILVDRNQKQNQLQKQTLILEESHNQVISKFSIAIDKFAAVVSGMRSYMNLSNEIPSAEELQHFVQNQLNDLNSKDSIVVSYIDTNHIFQYSFSRYHMNPVDLVGKSVSVFRSEEQLEVLNTLMLDDKLTLFPPINLVEGWVGLPINFRIHREGRTLGYLAPIISFESIMHELYEDESSKDFVFKFKFNDMFDFDRTQVYDGTLVYSQQEDPEHYANYELEHTDFIYTNLFKYGSTIEIGTAYKEKVVANSNFIYILWIGHFILTLLFFLLNKQMLRSRLLNRKMKETNALLMINREETARQNVELTKLNVTKNKLFSIVGHDVKQPLNSIKGLLHLLEDEEIEDAGLKNIITDLKDSTQSTVNLLDNLLRWSSTQTGSLDFNPTKFHINSLISEQFSILKQQASNKMIDLKLDLDKDLELWADKDMLGSAIRNLISNAIKYSYEKGLVLVSTKVQKEFLIIEIEDNGTGMKQKELDKFFELQAQVSKMGTSGESGTGLGLLLSQEFVKKHKGEILVKTTLKKGTKFSIVLPL